MTWINWEYFTARWLSRAQRGHEYIDDGDRFISLWIAFNGWVKGKFGEAEKDSTLVNRVKKSDDIRQIFEALEKDDPDFAELLQQLRTYTVADMRWPDDKSKTKRYNGTFDSLMDVLYKVRCNLFHGRKDIEDKDFQTSPAPENGYCSSHRDNQERKSHWQSRKHQN